MSVKVRYFAAAAAAAGVDEELVESGTLAEIVDRIGEKHGDLMVKVLPACSYLVDELATTDHTIEISPGQTIDILPPFAGG